MLRSTYNFDSKHWPNPLSRWPQLSRSTRSLDLDQEKDVRGKMNNNKIRLRFLQLWTEFELIILTEEYLQGHLDTLELQTWAYCWLYYHEENKSSDCWHSYSHEKAESRMDYILMLKLRIVRKLRSREIKDPKLIDWSKLRESTVCGNLQNLAGKYTIWCSSKLCFTVSELRFSG